MKVILANKTAEIVEKRSRFIASVFYVENVTDATKKLDEIKKKYYDAKHNCFAYRIGDIEKSSDDGEPSGTAGHPMLDILKGNELTNVIAIVTRYFGGVLLGTGGLQRAYSDSLKLALNGAEYAEITCGYELNFTLSYDDNNLLNKALRDTLYSGNATQNKQEYCSENIIELKKEYLENVNLSYLIPIKKFDEVREIVKNITKGKVIIENDVKKQYYMVNNSPKYI